MRKRGATIGLVSAAPRRVRVLVADDHPVFRDGIVRAIEERTELDLVGVASDGRAALEQISQSEPDVALLDIKMPGLDGAKVLRALQRDALPTKVLFLSAFGDPALVYEALEGGAAGFLSKDAERTEICEAVQRAARGETVLSPGLENGLAAQIRLRARDERPVLTPREREVLALLAEGQSAPDIARELVLSTTTIKTHLGHLYEKLGVSDRAAAVAEAMRRGLIE
jgi:two-component system, NarL family, nitrate/nitrite response regulator NarL